MSELITLARPYAKAAFEAARDADALARWSEQMTLAAMIARDHQMQRLMSDPRIEDQQLASVFVDVGGEHFADDFQRFLGVLAENGRLPLLPEIEQQFERFRRRAENRLKVQVVSAVALDEVQREQMKAALAKRFQKSIEMSNEVNEDLLGGAIIYAGDTVIDGSLRGRLNDLAAQLSH